MLRALVLIAIANLSAIVLLADATRADDHRPAWADRPATRTLQFVADPGLKETANGERLYRVMASLRPGERLLIGSGIYSVDRLWDLTVSGTAEAPIWIEAGDGARVVLTRPDARQNVLNIGRESAVEYLCLRGLEVTGGSHGIRIGRCSQLWIDRCHLHHTQGVCLSANSADTHHLYVTGNEIHHPAGTAEGMYLGGNHGEFVMSESVIANNHVYECRGSQGDGIEVKQGSWGNRIVENHVHDCNYPCITVYGTAGKPINVIERNVCYRSGDSVMQVQGEAIVRNNLLIAGKNAAFASTDHQGKTTRLQVLHNTLINTFHAFRGGSWNDREGMVLANNVIYSRDQNALHFANGSQGVRIEGNVLSGDGPKAGSQRGRGLQDFVDVTWDADRRDATPTAEAPFDHGVTEFRLPNDLHGNPRPTDTVISGAVTR